MSLKLVGAALKHLNEKNAQAGKKKTKRKAPKPNRHENNGTAAAAATAAPGKDGDFLKANLAYLGALAVTPQEKKLRKRIVKQLKPKKPKQPQKSEGSDDEFDKNKAPNSP